MDLFERSSRGFRNRATNPSELEKRADGRTGGGSRSEERSSLNVDFAAPTVLGREKRERSGLRWPIEHLKEANGRTIVLVTRKYSKILTIGECIKRRE